MRKTFKEGKLYEAFPSFQILQTMGKAVRDTVWKGKQMMAAGPWAYLLSRVIAFSDVFTVPSLVNLKSRRLSLPHEEATTDLASGDFFLSRTTIIWPQVQMILLIHSHIHRNWNIQSGTSSLEHQALGSHSLGSCSS